jgi:hypothetical protein
MTTVRAAAVRGMPLATDNSEYGMSISLKEVVV